MVGSTLDSVFFFFYSPNWFKVHSWLTPHYKLRQTFGGITKREKTPDACCKNFTRKRIGAGKKKLLLVVIKIKEWNDKNSWRKRIGTGKKLLLVVRETDGKLCKCPPSNFAPCSFYYFLLFTGLCTRRLNFKNCVANIFNWIATMFGWSQAEMLITSNVFSPLTNFQIFLIENSGHIQN